MQAEEWVWVAAILTCLQQMDMDAGTAVRMLQQIVGQREEYASSGFAEWCRTAMEGQDYHTSLIRMLVAVRCTYLYGESEGVSQEDAARRGASAMEAILAELAEYEVRQAEAAGEMGMVH